VTLLDLAEQPEPTVKKSRAELVADYFKAHPNEWIDGMVFAEFAGQYAWRSRIADCRTRYGMQIENRQRMIGPFKSTMSEYRYVPASSVGEHEGS
jgi:hypothetical protein